MKRENSVGTRSERLVWHVHREEADGEEIIRIISARRAEKNDIQRYQEQKME